MSDRTTEDCRAFLVEFFKETPDLVSGIFGDEEGEGEEVLRDALVAKNWKRRSKCRPGSDASYLGSDNTYNVWKKGSSYPKGPQFYTETLINASEIKNERVFMLLDEKYDGQVGFLVLESVNGELYVGDYVGD